MQCGARELATGRGAVGFRICDAGVVFLHDPREHAFAFPDFIASNLDWTERIAQSLGFIPPGPHCVGFLLIEAAYRVIRGIL